MASEDAHDLSRSDDADPDLPLVRALQSGEERALDKLMARHKEALFRFVYRYVLDHETAAELVQETFVRAYFKVGQYRPDARFVTWLYRVALNLCRDHVRSASARRAARTESLAQRSHGGEAGRDAPAPGQDPAEAAVSSEEVRRLQTAIDDLPHDLKTALILCALENRSHQECAQLLDTTPKAVETRLYRARQMLGKVLGRRSR